MEPSSVDAISILHVEDDPEFAELTATTLERESERVTVETATSVEDGRRILAEESVDCVLRDCDVTSEDGIQFLEDVRTEYPDLPVICYTGEELERIAEEVTALADRSVRSVTERSQYERKLTALHDVADDLASSDSVEDACERTIDASRDILTFDLSVINIEEDGVLSSVAVSEELPPEHETDMRVDQGLAGLTYRTGESYRVEDLVEHEDAEPRGPYRSAISVPVGDHGVFQAVAKSKGAFEDADLELATLLVSHTASTLDRLDQQRQLERQNEQLDEFASVVSHDLRNPLNVADLQLTLAREEVDSDHLDEVADAHERMELLIENLLELAREGKKVADYETIGLDTLVEQCWANVETKDATLAVETEKAIRADPDRVRQLLENLVRNAVEHGSASSRTESDDAVERGGSDVTVTVGDLPEGFYVADDGPGIPDDETEDVFEMGYSTVGDGTGFGLSIVDRIAEAHGWEIVVVDSDAGGARFEIRGVEEP